MNPSMQKMTDQIYFTKCLKALWSYAHKQAETVKTQNCSVRKENFWNLLAVLTRLKINLLGRSVILS